MGKLRRKFGVFAGVRQGVFWEELFVANSRF